MEGSAAPILCCRGITKRFGTVVACDRVDFDLWPGEVHAIIGENGAGKSTLMNVLYGMLAPDAGTIAVDGCAVRFSTCSDAIRAGIGMVFQHYLLVERFSVAENVLLGREPVRWGLLDRNSAALAVRRVSETYHFQLSPEASVEELGVGARQQVELLKALGRDPRIVILDEPTASLSPQEIDGLFEVIGRMRDDGRSVIFITHKLNEVMRVSDRITVLRRGKVAGALRTAEASAERLASLMIGEQPPPSHPSQRRELGDTILRVDCLSARADNGTHALDGVTVSVRAGEMVGVAGVEGNGQLELAETLYGLRPCTQGSIALAGVDLTRASLKARRRAGMRYIPADRQREGLILDFAAPENILLGNEEWMRRNVRVDMQAAASKAAEIAAALRIHRYSGGTPMRSYSGGTQQKFLVGREAEKTAVVVIAFAPTRGVDIGASALIYERFRDLCARGACLLLISYDLDEIKLLSDRIIVLSKGRIAGDLRPEEADDQTLGKLMGGTAA